MTRLEFSKQTKRRALARSGARCEAVGRAYGFPAGQRCSASLAYGVEFDHYPVRATDGGSNALENCVSVCIRCHRWKTTRHDLPQLAKGRRIRDKHRGIRETGRRFPTGRHSRFKKMVSGQVVKR